MREGLGVIWRRRVQKGTGLVCGNRLFRLRLPVGSANRGGRWVPGWWKGGVDGALLLSWSSGPDGSPKPVGLSSGPLLSSDSFPIQPLGRGTCSLSDPSGGGTIALPARARPHVLSLLGLPQPCLDAVMVPRLPCYPIIMGYQSPPGPLSNTGTLGCSHTIANSHEGQNQVHPLTQDWRCHPRR